MTNALKIALKAVRETIEELDLNLNFKEEIKEDEFSFTVTDATLEGMDDEILIDLNVDEDIIFFTATFDKLVLNERSLQLLQTLNQENLFLRAYVGSRGYLVLDHVTPLREPESVGEVVVAFLSALARMAENQALQELTEMTE